MATSTGELQDILGTLDNLRARVEAMSAARPAPEQPVAATAEPTVTERTLAREPGGLDAAQTAMLLGGLGRMNGLHQQREFVEFFCRLARQSGLRLLLLKRWTSGLQVYHEEGVKLPEEARKKRSDGRAPIPLAKGDIFVSVAEETTVYAGPVPARNFPLDLTLMLGRGAKDRRIIILPLPSQGHWNTFLYLDGDDGDGPWLVLAEVLARYALSRMYLLEKGVHLREGRVDAILKSELARRGEARRSRVVREEAPAPAQAATRPAVPEKLPAQEHQEHPAPARPETEAAAVDEDTFAMIEQALRGGRKTSSPPPSEPPAGPVADPVAGPVAAPGAEAAAGPVADPDAEAAAGPAEAADMTAACPLPSAGFKQLRPEDILHHSGELPALPKAACHIMAVIEDPKTTATRLERALAMDQALTAKVLRIANSPFYGAVREIKTVSESIVRLGFVAIRNWTLVTAARSVFLAPGAGILYRKIWQQSVMSAMAGQLVAQEARLRDPETVFIGGLMQNIGQLVLARSNPEFFQEILLESTSTGKPYHVIERNLLGYDHGELGALLIREWNLSPDLEEAVRWHHRFDDPRAKNARIAAMIALGEEIAWCSGAAAEGADADGQDQEGQEIPVSKAARFLGFSAEKIASLTAQAASLKIDPHFFS